jgi:hypothetical protein
MKKNVIKMTFAAVCVVAAGVSGMKAYNAANQSEADMLLSENVEALSSGVDGGKQPVDCYNSITTHKASQVRFCGDCSWHDGTYTTTSLSGKCNED